MYAEMGCKGTKKIPYTQIYMGNSFKNVDFVRKFEVLRSYNQKNFKEK